MATRLYFPSDLESPITTAYDTAFWNPGHLDYAIRRALSLAKTASDFQTQVVIKDTVNTGGEFDLLRQYISAPLTTGGAINGTVKAQFRTMQSGSVSTDAEEAISIRVVSGDGATVRGILFNQSINVGAFETVLTNRAFAAAGYTNLTEVVASVGDRIVVEIGVFIGCAGTPCDPDIAIIEFGDDSASDLPENNTGTDQYCPWVEFSLDLAFDEEGAGFAVIGSGGVKVGGVGVIAFLTPGIEEVIGSGGVVVGGEGVFGFLDPDVLAVVGEGGVEVGGEGVIGFVSQGIEAVIGHGGVEVGGQGIIDFLDAASTILAVVGSGGVAVGGIGVVEFLSPSIHAVIGSGGVVVGSFRVPETTVVGFVEYTSGVIAVVGSGGVEVGGAGVIAFTSASIYAVPLPQSVAAADVVVGGTGIISFISHQILEVIGEGGVVVGGGETTPPDVFETYVMTGARGEPSIYSNYAFNSYCRYRGQYFGAGMEGIYLLEGANDAGEEIYPGMRIGPFNAGTDREKRIRLLRCGGSTTGAEVRVSDGNGTSDYAPVERGRAAISRKVQSREITIEVSDFETLDFLEIALLVLHKR